MSGGTPVTITGTNLPPQSANPTLTIDNVPLTQVTVVNGDTMTGVTGAHAAGGPFMLELQFPLSPTSTYTARLGRAFTYVTFTPPSLTIAVNAGNNQSATVGLSVPVAPSVIVRDASNNPVAGVAVTFAVASGGGAVTGASQTTDASGIATVGGWGLGTTAGANTLTATATGSGITGNPVTFTATGTAGAAYVVGVSAGNNQSASPGSAVPVPPALFAHDFWGNPVAGLAVTFAVASGGGSITGASQTTNASGIATVGSWSLGTAPGTNTLTATATGSGIAGNPVTFTATGVSASGVDLTFVGGGATCVSNPQDWSCAANWSPARVPTSADSVFIPNTVIYPPSLTANAVAGAVQISGLVLSLDGHTLTVTNGFMTTGTGFLRMTNALDSLVVGGDAIFNGGEQPATGRRDGRTRERLRTDGHDPLV